MNLINHLQKRNNNEDKIGLFILGAQKCGTTSLHHYLNQHPLLLGSQPKETDFFSFDKLYKKGVQWYHGCFDTITKPNRLFKFDCSTEYLYIPYCAKRIKEYNPNSKFIIIKRDPFNRAISAYKMYKALSEGKLWSRGYLEKLESHNKVLGIKMISLLNRQPFPEFVQLIEEEFSLLSKRNYEFIYEPSLIARGDYENQIRNFLLYFPEENILEIDFERYSNNTINVLNEILAFLGIKNEFFDEHYDLTIKLKSNESFSCDGKRKNYLNNMFNKVYQKKKYVD